MFLHLGRFLYRFRRSVPLVAVTIVVLSFVLSLLYGGKLSSGGWDIPGSESVRASDLLGGRFGVTRSSMFVLYRDPSGDASSPAFQAAIGRSLARVAVDPSVEKVVSYSSTPDPSFLSQDRHASFALVQLREEFREAIEDAPRLASLVERPAGIETYISGTPLLTHEFNAAIEHDLVRGEAISLPIALVILLLVFGSVVGASLPLVMAGLAIPTAFALIGLAASRTEMSIYVTNVASMLGLALSIDYSLFLVSRFREELREHEVAVAVERTVATVGKAVAVSGVAVAVGLSSLIVFSAPALRSMGIGGVIGVLSALCFSLFVMPAVLGMLGPRVNRLRLPLPPWLRPASVDPDARAERHGAWARIASFVMAHPVRVAAPVLAVLLIAGLPFLRVQLSTGGNISDLLPTQARRGAELLRDEFRSGDASPSVIALRYRDATFDASRRTALADYVAHVGALEGVTAVGSVLTPPPGVAAHQYLGVLALPPSQRPAQTAPYLARWMADDVLRLEVHSRVAPDSNAGRALVRQVREVPPPPGAERLVAGISAQSADFLAAFGNAVPVAVAIVILVTLLVLFVTFGSVLLPLKAVAMSLLSITASFGALVWVFQEGNLAGPLGFTPAGALIASTPVIMFAILFGLSMDYEVLLLSRIRERYLASGENRRAVAEGIGETGAIISGAALIMVAVFGAFALGQVVMLKALGLGMALAVLVDATIVRGVLVPAFMRLLGDRNWWAPARLQRLVARLGLYEGAGTAPTDTLGGERSGVPVSG